MPLLFMVPEGKWGNTHYHEKGTSGKTKIDIDISRGIGKMPNRVDVLNTDQYLTMRREAIVNDNAVLTPQDSVALSDVFLWNSNRNVDWQEELLGGTAEQTPCQCHFFRRFGNDPIFVYHQYLPANECDRI